MGSIVILLYCMRPQFEYNSLIIIIFTFFAVKCQSYSPSSSSSLPRLCNHNMLCFVYKLPPFYLLISALIIMTYTVCFGVSDYESRCWCTLQWDLDSVHCCRSVLISRNH